MLTGREAPGQCWRLYQEAAFEQRAAAAPPEILRVDLAEVVLQLLVAGVRDVGRFDFVSPPQPHALAAALARLAALGALALRTDGTPTTPRARSKGSGRGGGNGHGDGSGDGADAPALATLTAHGRRMALLPLSPLWAHTLLLAEAHGCVAEVLTCAALLSVEPVLLVPGGGGGGDSGGRGSADVDVGAEKDHARAAAAAAHRAFTSPDGDLPTLLAVYNAFWAVAAIGSGSGGAATSAAAPTKAPVVFTDNGGDNDGDAAAAAAAAAATAATAALPPRPAKKGRTATGGLGSAADAAERRRWAVAHHVSWRALQRAGQVRRDQPPSL